MNSYLAYICAACGDIVEVPLEVVEPLDSGTTITCPKCGGDTVVDLSTPEERAIRYQEWITKTPADQKAAGERIER